MELHCGEDVLCYVENTNSLLSNDMEDSSDNYIYEKWLQKQDYFTIDGQRKKRKSVISLEADPLLSEAQIIEGHTLLEAFEIRIPQPQYVPAKSTKPPESLHAILKSFRKTNNKNKNSVRKISRVTEETCQVTPKKPKPKESPQTTVKVVDNIIDAIIELEEPNGDITEDMYEYVVSSPEIESQQAILRSVGNTHDANMNPCNTYSDISESVTKNDILLTKTLDTVEMIFLHNAASLIFKDAGGYQIFSAQHMQLPESYVRPEKIQKVKSVSQVQICKELEHTLPQILTNLGAKIHLCPLRCTKAFLHIADAKLHALKHMQIKPYKCDQPNCSWEFYTACKLTRHKETHEKNKNFICDIENCKKTFSTIYNLNEHKKKHAKPAIIPCPVGGCHLFFQNEKQKRSHCKSHNHNEAPFKCNNGKCTKSFFTKTLSDVHSRTCNEKSSAIKCKYPNCEKSFGTQYRLREHIRQHTGVKPYKCKYENCTWCFATASKLKRHQSIHTRERNFHCTIGDCQKSFFRSEHLKEHTLTHIEKRIVEAEGGSVFQSHIKKISLLKKVECTKVQPEEEDNSTGSTNADALLEQAIQSLGVPSDMMMGTGLIPDEPVALLENENFSTVNLRDLD